MAPWSSWQARFAWSAAPAMLLLVWVFGNLAGTVAAFPVSYTFDQITARVWNHGLWNCFAQSFEDRSWGWFFLWAWPAGLLAMWVLLLTARTKRWRVSWSAGLLICAGWPFLLRPELATTPVLIYLAVFDVAEGESYQEGALQIGTLLLWVLLAIPCVCFALTERPRKGRCGQCGYELAGLRGDKCPECGTQLRAAQ